MNPAHLLNAIAFAAHKHRRQRRKDADATPYINHPIAVATLLAVEGDVEDQATLFCAILHDTVEDTDTTFSELEERFGQEVADLVRELTDDKSLKKYERKRLQIEHATQSSSRAKLVKIADKHCNVRDLTAISYRLAPGASSRILGVERESCRWVPGCEPKARSSIRPSRQVGSRHVEPRTQKAAVATEFTEKGKAGSGIWPHRSIPDRRLLVQASG